jgi:multicomponent Na+:H+ antiporter subunit G
MIEISKFFIALLVLFGALLSLLTALGLLRLPDIYTRSHAATKSATLGVICILSGTFFYFWVIEGIINVRLILGIIFVFITAPVAGHLICRAAYRTKVPLWEKSIQDDLKLALQEEDYQQNVEK